MMNARLLVATVLLLVLAAPALPESQLSAAQDSTIVNAAVGVEVPTVVSTIAFTSPATTTLSRGHYPQPPGLWAGRSTSSTT